MARPRSIISSGDVEITAPEIGGDIGDLDVIPAHKMRDKVAEMKFMEEKVIVEIEADDDPNAPVFVPSGHNGVIQYIQRGIPQTVKRKFLYSLLAAQRIKFACAFGKDQAGNDLNRMNPNGQTAVRVRLVSDNNPEGGMNWVQRVMRETNNMPTAASL